MPTYDGGRSICGQMEDVAAGGRLPAQVQLAASRQGCQGDVFAARPGRQHKRCQAAAVHRVATGLETENLSGYRTSTVFSRSSDIWINNQTKSY